MDRRLMVFLAAPLAATCMLRAADGDFKASCAYDGSFAVNTVDASPFVAASAAEIAALPPVGYAKGETVTASGARWTRSSCSRPRSSSNARTANGLSVPG